MVCKILILFTAFFISMGGRARAQSIEYAGSGLWTDVIDVQVAGDYAFCALINGLMVIDISDLTSPQFVGQFYFPGTTLDLCIDGEYVYMAVSDSGLQVLNIKHLRSYSSR